MTELRSISLSLFLIVSLVSGCGLSELKKEKKHDSDDKVNTFSSQAPFERPTDCRAHIAEAICLVEPDGDGTRFPDNSTLRPCLDGGQRYAAVFEQLYDVFPTSLQKMFCSMQRINVEKTFYGTAYADTIWVKSEETGKWRTNGGVLGIRQSILDSQLDLAAWASWKEQLSFGGSKDSYAMTENLPLVETHSPDGTNDLLYFLIVHEFGHFFDEASGVNTLDSCEGEANDRKCKFKDNTWGAISWLDSHTVKPESDFAKRDGLCFYTCDGNYIAADEVPAIYAAIERSSFISAYAATNPYEEFADSFTYFIMNEHLRSSFSFLPPNGAKYDVMAKLKEPAFADKAKFLSELQDTPYYP